MENYRQDAEILLKSMSPELCKRALVNFYECTNVRLKFDSTKPNEEFDWDNSWPVHPNANSLTTELVEFRYEISDSTDGSSMVYKLPHDNLDTHEWKKTRQEQERERRAERKINQYPEP